MTKFRCTENSRDFVEVLRDEEGRPALTVGDNHSASVAFLAPSDAPALALAIFEAAGVRPVAYDLSEVSVGSVRELSYIVHLLKIHTKAQAERATEARERAELEAEALKFYFAFHSAVDRPCQDWDYLHQQDKQKWLAVARRAREMRAEK